MRTLLAATTLLVSLLTGQEPAKIAAFQFSAETLGGRTITQDDYKANVLIVDLWGTWCPPCRQAIPKLVELYERYKHQGLEIVGFNFTSGGGGEDAKVVRDFAVENRITYELAVGAATLRDQVPGFQGYPTLLLFKKGLVHDDTHVGFQDGDEDKLDGWIRKALQLDKPDTSQAERDEAKEKQEVAKEKVPAGKVFMPGNGDTGFGFEVEDVDGKTFTFEELRGKPVLLALTTTWDQEAVRTATLLEQLRQENARLQVVAACLERTKDPAKRRAAIDQFRTERKLGYRLFAADLAFASGKVHLFAALPTLLLFDADGKLVLRESGFSDGTVERLRAGLAERK